MNALNLPRFESEGGNVIPPLQISKVKLEQVFGVVVIKANPFDAFVDRIAVDPGKVLRNDVGSQRRTMQPRG
jgi:hypothetical protein